MDNREGLYTLCLTNTLTLWTIKSGPKFCALDIEQETDSRIDKTKRDGEYDTTDINYNTKMDSRIGPGHPSIPYEDVPGSCSVDPQ